MINIISVLKNRRTKSFVYNYINEIINNDKRYKDLLLANGIRFLKILKNDDKNTDVMVKTDLYTYIYSYDKITREIITKGERKNVNFK